MVIIEPITSLIPMPDFFIEIMKKLLQPNIYTFISVAIAAPILEELLFRGVILEGFLKNYSPTKAIIYSALLFGLIHFNPWQFIGGFIIGMVIGWLYWKTNSLIPGILIHFVNNSLSFMAMYYTEDMNTSLEQSINNPTFFYGLLATAALILGVTYVILNRHFSSKATPIKA